MSKIRKKKLSVEEGRTSLLVMDVKSKSKEDEEMGHQCTNIHSDLKATESASLTNLRQTPWSALYLNSPQNLLSKEVTGRSNTGEKEF